MTIQAINVRNQFRGKVKAIIEGSVVSEVDIETPAGIVTSVITTRSVRDLGLVIGTEVVALVKATDYDGDSLRDRASPLLDAFFVANVTRGVKFAIDNKLIKQGFDIDAWIDRRSFNDALRSLGDERFWSPHDAKGAPQG